MNTKVSIILLLSTIIYSSSFGMADLQIPKRMGKLTVFTGPMCCGKTERLMAEIKEAAIAHKTVFVCKPVVDTRGKNLLCSRGRTSEEINVNLISDPQDILTKFNEKPFDHLYVDEIQFANATMIAVIETLLNKGINVTASGLDMNFRRQPFGTCMPALLAMADKIKKMKAVCQCCFNTKAKFTQRLVSGKPALKSDPDIVIEGAVKSITYEPRCGKHHELPE